MYNDKDRLDRIAKILKENLKPSVDIDTTFMKAFEEKLDVKVISKFTEMQQMENQKKSNAFGQILSNKLFKVSFAALAVVFVAALLVSILSGSKGLLKDTRNPNLIAQLYVNSGKVDVLRNGNKLVFEADTELTVGDMVSVAEDTVADIKTAYGRLILDSSSQLALSEKNGSLYATVIDGNVFVSLTKDASNISLATPNAQVMISNGSVFISQNGVLPTTTSNDSVLSKAYAAEGDGSTKIGCFSGKATVITATNEYQIEAGKELIVAANNTVSAAVELDKAVVSAKLSTRVATSNTENDDIGYMADVTAPEVTVIAPTEGAVLTTSSVQVKFSSNEAGYYNWEDRWEAMSANQEVTFDADLVNGANKIEFMVKDAAYNKRTVTINVTAQISESYTMGWVKNPQALTSGVRLDWSTSGAKVGQTYKVFRNGSLYKSFPVKADTKIGANWTDTATVKGQSYTYVVGLYDGSKELAKNEAKSIVAQTSPISTNCTIVVTRGAASTVNWVATNCAAESGFKVVWSPTAGPIYPDPSPYSDTYYSYYSDGNTRSGEVNGDGTLHVRVCEYHPEAETKCTNYSNELVATF